MVDENRARALVFFGDGTRDYLASRRAVDVCGPSGETLRDEFIDGGAWTRGETARDGDSMDVDSDARERAIERARWVLRMGKFTRLAAVRFAATAAGARLDGGGEGDPAVARRAAVSLSSALVALMRRDDARWGETGVELCASSFRGRRFAIVGDVLEDLSAASFEDDVTRRAMRLLCENIARSGGGGALAWTLALVPRVWDAFGTGVDASCGNSSPAIGNGFERRRVDVCVDVARRGRRLGNVLQPVKTHIDCLTPRLACVVARAAARVSCRRLVR